MTRLVTKARNLVFSKHNHKRTLGKFADDMGLLYCGSAGNVDSDIRTVRGVTLSPSRQDRHHVIGSSEDYDIAIIERLDTIKHFKFGRSSHSWLIMRFDLRAIRDLPHTYISLRNKPAGLLANITAKFSYLQPLKLDTSEARYPKGFSQRYEVYGPLSKKQRIAQMVSPAVAKTIERHFGSLEVEYGGRTLYIYSEHHDISRPLLDAMLSNGLWFARYLDGLAKK